MRLLVQLNRADAITLTGLALTGGALWLISAGALYYALSTLYIAMLADALDGYLARRWGLAREFGRYLDGFVDAALYLFVPACWAWSWGFQGPLAAAVLFLVSAAGIVRLAVFNQTGNTQKDGQLAYQGMPVFWLLFLLGGAVILGWLIGADRARALLYVAYPAAALLMVWDRPFFKFNRMRTILVLVLSGAAVFAIAGLLEGT